MAASPLTQSLFPGEEGLLQFLLPEGEKERCGFEQFKAGRALTSRFD